MMDHPNPPDLSVKNKEDKLYAWVLNDRSRQRLFANTASTISGMHHAQNAGKKNSKKNRNTEM